MVEDHLMRLRATLVAPEVDRLWAGLSVLLQVVFYISWAFFVILRVPWAIVTMGRRPKNPVNG